MSGSGSCCVPSTTTTRGGCYELRRRAPRRLPSLRFAALAAESRRATTGVDGRLSSRARATAPPAPSRVQGGDGRVWPLVGARGRHDVVRTLDGRPRVPRDLL